MQNSITTEIVVAYSQCPRKAFLLLCTDEQGTPHEYMRILEDQKNLNQISYLHAHAPTFPQQEPQIINDLNKKGNIIFQATLRFGDLEARCAVLTQAKSSNLDYEPTIVIGTYSVTREQELELTFSGFVLGQMQKQLPIAGHIVKMGGQVNTLKLEPNYKTLKRFLDPLRQWLVTTPADPPPVILNKYCPSCQFRTLCRVQAEKEDNLSLLDRVTPKIMQQYHKKGIFTVTQLSYTYKPRRSRKQAKRKTVLHKLELQALAVRTNKIYIQELPILSRQPVELFLDIEGIPDQHCYYLFGLLVCENKNCSYHPFWVDTTQNEERSWRQFLEKVSQYPEIPIYHYGTYEPRAVEKLAALYQTDCSRIKQRLVNVLSFIYGKVYFPTQSNSLKNIGKSIGASWSSPDASGLQTLVWRHHWDKTQDTEYKQLLMTYNKEDCLALHILINELTRIQSNADSQTNIDFANHPKQFATSIGEQIHNRFETILKFAHANYNEKKIRIQSDETEENTDSEGQAKSVGHPGYTIPRATKIIHIPLKGMCPKCGDVTLQPTTATSERTIVDLVFTKNGCRKSVTKYIRPEGYCQHCQSNYSPKGSSDFPPFHLYGHGLQAWVIYQRLVLRLPYRLITQATEDLFNVHISGANIVNFLNDFASYYADSEQLLIKRILASPYVHADETTINIRGIDQYVWVFTDGTHVVFKLTETREAAIVHDFLSGYQGILISDFYPGYDSVQCRQQKCLVHLIRDMNDDLWKSPFDSEFEAFVLGVKNLIVPMLEAVQKYGLKKKHLHKFSKQIDQFYEKVITGVVYHSDFTIKYQSRFKRYKQSLFTFIEQDGIPWNNNMAERAIRHLAVQRKISGFFFKSVAPRYLLMLGITQTCRFQDKSLLKFLMSGEKDIDMFQATRKSPKRTLPAISFNSPIELEGTDSSQV